uniref:NADH-ubiquinone oxidoreductase chain 3 n=2 Tax=Dermestes TaxID=219541 RepID=A0A6C0RVN2_9COLE|nr:NADH dehydrogenase subunit 3 [Dermestes tessellatocollis]QEK77721.1 NADH dehydrogenase subunit 3 [Dermestes tessellatocollis]QIA46726.1 NADH dehydrogenase subunit 3 [Dermestes maculatus]
MIWIVSMIIMVISSLLITICSIISKKTFMDREKMSPFECGFDPKTSSRLPFSLQFFLIAVIFLIFDVEITLLIPLIIVMKTINSLMFMTLTISFILILIGGLFHEWKQGALEWTY